MKGMGTLLGLCCAPVIAAAVVAIAVKTEVDRRRHAEWDERAHLEMDLFEPEIRDVSR